MNLIKQLLAILVSITLFAIVACGGGEDDSKDLAVTPAASLSGVAAVDDPIVNGNIAIKCAAGATLNTTTSSTGAWQVSISGQTPPCAVQVSGGTVRNATNPEDYHSIAVAFSTVNVTPLTDLLLANLVGSATPSGWFNAVTTEGLAQITQTLIDTALTNQCAAFSSLTPLCTTDPITTVFTPVSGNIMYNMLIALQIAISNSEATYSDLRNDAATVNYAQPGAAFNAALLNAYNGTTAPTISATANTTSQDLTVGTAMSSFSPLTAIGGVPPYVYRVTGTLPTGLSFDTSTGVVTGTPTVIYAMTNLIFSVADANEVVAATTSSVSFSVSVAPSGSLDTSFNLSGKVLTSFGISGEIAKAVAIQADGKIIVAGSVAGFLNGTFALARYNIDGTLDTAFGTNGKVTTTGFGSNVSGANAVAIDSDGKIVVAGYWGDGGGIGALAIARYNIDGILDTSFGTGGKVSGASATGVIQAMALQSDQKILIAGGSGLVRYSSNGSIDTTFGTSGLVTTSIGLGYTATSVVIQADNKIITAGYYVLANGTTRAFALVRYNATGSLDTSFDTDGIVTTSIGAAIDLAYAVSIQTGDNQTGDKIVVSGTTLANGATGYDLALVRYHSDGSLDTSFGVGGIVTADMGYSDAANGLAIQADDKVIVAAGYTATNLALGTGGGAGAPFSLVRYNADGSLDTTFGNAGKVTVGEGASQAIVIQADNKILAVGSLHNGTDNDFGVVRLMP